MFANTKKHALAEAGLFMALGLVSATTFAQGSNITLPEVPAGRTAAKVQSSATQGGTFVIGEPVGLQSKDGERKVLPYRDPTQPLSIGEMSEIQKGRAVEAFLKKAGFTTERPPAPKIDSQKPVVERVQSQITVTALYAHEGREPWAELKSPDGSLIKVRAGTQIAKRISVQGVDGDGLIILVEPEKSKCKAGAKSSASKGKCLAPTATTTSLGAGDDFRWFD